MGFSAYPLFPCCQPVAEDPMEESEGTEDGESRRCKEPGSLNLHWEESCPGEMSGTCKLDFSQKRNTLLVCLVTEIWKLFVTAIQVSVL